jgi:hypothetical protein
MKIRRIVTRVLVSVMVFGVLAYAVPINPIQADTALVTGIGTNEVVTSRGGMASVTYNYENVENAIFKAITIQYRWDPEIMTFDSISGSDFLYQDQIADPENGMIQIRLDYINVKTSNPTVTLNFKDCFVTTTTETTTSITSNATVLSFPYEGEEYFTLYPADMTSENVVFVDGSVTLDVAPFGMETEDEVLVCQTSYVIKLTVDGLPITAEQLQQVTWSIELLGGFVGEASDYASISDSTLTFVKSGVVKVTAHYGSEEASMILVKPGDIDGNGVTNEMDLARIADYIDSAGNDTDALGSSGYGEYLADMNANGNVDEIDLAMIDDYLNE